MALLAGGCASESADPGSTGSTLAPLTVPPSTVVPQPGASVPTTKVDPTIPQRLTPTTVLATLTVEESVVARGGRVCGKPVKVDITQVGPSQVVLAFNVPGVGRVAIVETVTPQAPGLQRVLHAVYGAPGVPRAAAKAILWSTVQA